MDPALQAYLDGELTRDDLPRTLRSQADAWSRLVDSLRRASPQDAPGNVREEVMDVLQRERVWAAWRQARKSGESGEVDPETGLLSLTGLLHSYTVLGALAERRQAVLSCVVLGPTRPADERDADRKRQHAARLCATNVRASDLCGWVAREDLAVVAFDTPADGAQTLARRLVARAEEEYAAEGRPLRLSAGILELDPARRASDPPELPEEVAEAGTPGGEGDEDEEARRAAREEVARVLARGAAVVRPGPEDVEAFAAAQRALNEARQEGGGIRLADEGSEGG